MTTNPVSRRLRAVQLHSVGIWSGGFVFVTGLLAAAPNGITLREVIETVGAALLIAGSCVISWWFNFHFKYDAAAERLTARNEEDERLHNPKTLEG